MYYLADYVARTQRIKRSVLTAKEMMKLGRPWPRRDQK